MIRVTLTGTEQTRAKLEAQRVKLTNPSGLEERLTLAVARYYRGVAIPTDTGRLARAYREPVGESRTALTTSARGWEYTRTITVPYAKFQAHRVRSVPRRVLAEAWTEYLEE